ncbi:MAG: hypothetical protein D6802_01695 [Ardenticatenia bacterium]|nr:MAG: hypothetical protein D6802_01695 [Ardenticatenia bacterium]
MTTRTKHIEHRLPLIWGGALFLMLATWYSDWSFDDPFVTYRYAQNLAHGHGLVYTPGEHLLNTTSPLWAIILAPLAQMGLDLPKGATLLSALALALSAVLLAQLGRQWRTPLVGLSAMFLFPLLPYVRQALGSEMPMLILFALAAIRTYTRGQMHAASLLLALAVLTRTDAVLLAFLVGLHALAHRKLTFTPIALLSTPLALWHGWAAFFYGSPFPATLATKQAQARMAISQSFTEGAINLLTKMAQTPVGALLLLLLLIGALTMWWKPASRMWVFFVIWSALHGMGYAILHVSRYFWYYVPLMLGAAVAIGAGLALVLRRVPRQWRTAFFIILACWNMLYLWHDRTSRDWRIGLYTQTGQWLATHTAPEATIGTLEVGIIGYYAQRRMIDFAGLLQPELANLMFYDTNYDLLALWAFAHYAPDYVAIRDDTLAPLKNASLFQSRCRLLHTVHHASTSRVMYIYACHEKSRPSP